MTETEITTELDRLDVEIAQTKQRVAESRERSDTDGFLSQWAGSLTASKLQRQRSIVAAGGYAEFTGLYTVDGFRVKAKRITTPHPRGWGEQTVWLLHDSEVSEYGRRFIPTGEKSRVQKTLGLCERPEMAPAKAIITGSGRGLSGTAWVTEIRTGDEWGGDAIPV